MSSSRDLPDADIRPVSLKSPELAGKFITTSATCKAPKVSQGLNQSESRAAFYPEDVKLNLFPILLCLLTEFSTTVRCSVDHSRFLEVTYIPWLVPSTPHLQSRKWEVKVFLFFIYL